MSDHLYVPPRLKVTLVRGSFEDCFSNLVFVGISPVPPISFPISFFGPHGVGRPLLVYVLSCKRWPGQDIFCCNHVGGHFLAQQNIPRNPTGRDTPPNMMVELQHAAALPVLG